MTMRVLFSRLPVVSLAVCAAWGGLATAETNGFDPWTQTARYELEHRVNLSAWASADKHAVRVWLPVPAETGYQRVLSKTIQSPWNYRETRNANGNRFVYVESDGSPRTDVEVVMRFVVERSPRSGSKLTARANAALDPRRHIGSRSRIPTVGKISEFAKLAGTGLRTDAKRIRAYYDYVTNMMKYDKSGTGWGQGDAAWACDSKYGNCTDFHSVIIGMCRSQGIPARFVMGFSIPSNSEQMQIGGYHCWAEAYDRSFGWLPMDASEAWKSKRFDDYFGHLPSDRVEYVVGRDLVLEPPQNGEPLNYIIYPYAEVNGKPAGDVPWELRARRLGASHQ